MTASPTSSSSPSSPTQQLHTTAIVGSTMGVVLFLVVVSVFIYLLMHLQRRRKKLKTRGNKSELCHAKNVGGMFYSLHIKSIERHMHTYMII